MSRKLAIIFTVLVVVVLATILIPDPTVEWHYFRDTFQNIFLKTDFKLVGLETYVEPPPASKLTNIPWWIRFHPRRYFSEAWQKDFIGLSSGVDLYTFRKNDVYYYCHVYSIRQRRCSITIKTTNAGKASAGELKQLIRKKYPRLHISISYKQTT